MHSVDENEDVLVSVGGPVDRGVGLLTLNRPKAINSLTHPMVGAISAALKAWENDDAVRAVVISGAGDVSRPRRRKLITDHEAVHVWQARWFGPCYLPLYGLWAGVGVLGGVLLWLRRGRNEPLGTMIESCSYYTNPFEWWAYSRDDLWPPPGLVTGVGWRNAAVRPLADVRVRRYVDSD